MGHMGRVASLRPVPLSAPREACPAARGCSNGCMSVLPSTQWASTHQLWEPGQHDAEQVFIGAHEALGQGFLGQQQLHLGGRIQVLKGASKQEACGKGAGCRGEWLSEMEGACVCVVCVCVCVWRGGGGGGSEAIYRAHKEFRGACVCMFMWCVCDGGGGL
jgi:hypothetical protein